LSACGIIEDMTRRQQWWLAEPDAKEVYGSINIGYACSAFVPFQRNGSRLAFTLFSMAVTSFVYRLITKGNIPFKVRLALSEAILLIIY
jgi:hypothetical protein